MALPKVCTSEYVRGFTVPEVCLVMVLLAVIGSLGLSMGMESLRGGAFRDDRDVAVAGLRRARSLAIDNVCFGKACAGGGPHGVRFYPKGDANAGRFVIFQGTDYESRDASVDEAVEFEDPEFYIDASSTTDIVFERLSGDAVSRQLISRDNLGRASTISVNGFGRIDWQ